MLAALSLAAGPFHADAGGGNAPAATAPAGLALAGIPPGVVDASAARTLVAAGAKVVDVRTPAEFAAGHVPGAVNIPFDEMGKRHAEIGPPSTPVLVYCRTGHRSGIAGQTLREKGFIRIFDLKSYDLWARSQAAAPR
jgi:rhodanese-related sulfurtransferase